MGSKYDDGAGLHFEYSRSTGLLPINEISDLFSSVRGPVRGISAYSGANLISGQGELTVNTEIGKFEAGGGKLSLLSENSEFPSNEKPFGRGLEFWEMHLHHTIDAPIIERDWGSRHRDESFKLEGKIGFSHTGHDFNQRFDSNAGLSHFNLTHVGGPNVDFGVEAQYTYGRLSASAELLGSLPLSKRVNFTTDSIFDAPSNPVSQIPNGFLEVSGNPLTVSNTQANLEAALRIGREDGFNAEVFAGLGVRALPNYSSKETNEAGQSTSYQTNMGLAKTVEAGVRIGFGSK